MRRSSHLSRFFFFNDTATTEIYTLSLHDALPISWAAPTTTRRWPWMLTRPASSDRKSTRLNFSHLVISYAVFCLKKKTTLDHLGYRVRLLAHAERDGHGDHPL